MGVPDIRPFEHKFLRAKNLKSIIKTLQVCRFRIRQQCAFYYRYVGKMVV